MRLQISGTVVITNHQILERLRWEGISALPTERPYSHSVMLNDSQDSVYGEGIYLDRSIRGLNRRPNFDPIVPEELGDWTVLGV
ncbi:MAG: hypothetical protein AAF702_14045 [Chloroflexota bacterium]